MTELYELRSREWWIGSLEAVFARRRCPPGDVYSVLQLASMRYEVCAGRHGLIEILYRQDIGVGLGSIGGHGCGTIDLVSRCCEADPSKLQTCW